MIDYSIEGTSETPTIKFNSTEGYLLIEGRSIPENSISFYEPLLNCLKEYNNNPIPNTKVDFRFEYFNTSSSKCILDILRVLQTIHTGSSDVNIDWYYDEDDEEILEIGQDYSHIIKVPFNLKVIIGN